MVVRQSFESWSALPKSLINTYLALYLKSDICTWFSINKKTKTKQGCIKISQDQGMQERRKRDRSSPVNVITITASILGKYIPIYAVGNDDELFWYMKKWQAQKKNHEWTTTIRKWKDIYTYILHRQFKGEVISLIPTFLYCCGFVRKIKWEDWVME